MGSASGSVAPSLWIFLVCAISLSCAMGTFGCAERASACLRCADAGCVKCARLIVLGSRACVDACPSSHREEWSARVDYMGRVCREVNFLGLPGRALAALVGACSGAAVGAGALLGTALFLRRRRRHHRRELQRAQSQPQLLPESEAAPEVCARTVLLRRVSALRPDAPVFLAMLNDTRRQVRALRRPDPYRPVLRDLARILLLLNRRQERARAALQEPSAAADWTALLDWGERALRRYKLRHPQQVAQAQLVSFLQVPVQTNPLVECEGSHRELTTFQPYSCKGKGGVRASCQSLQELAISALDSNYSSAPLLQPSLIDSCSTEFNACWEFPATNYTTVSEWSASRDYLVDDDFFSLGLRPQDEITTEL